MKYLKLFKEGLQYENSKLTEDEFYDEVGDGLELINFDNFTLKEIEKIKAFVKKQNPKFSCELVRTKTTKIPTLGIMLNCKWVIYGSGYVFQFIDYPAVNIEVMKNNDEWFYIKKEVKNLVRLRNIDTSSTSETFYKCDQIEGLLQTLEQIMSI